MSLQPEMEVNEPNLSLKNLIPKLCCFWFPQKQNDSGGGLYSFRKMGREHFISNLFENLRLLQDMMSSQVFFVPTFPFASIEASALRNKPSRETGVN